MSIFPPQPPQPWYLKVPFLRIPLKKRIEFRLIHTPFFTVESHRFQKTETELLSYEMPITKILEDNSVKDLREAFDNLRWVAPPPPTLWQKLSYRIMRAEERCDRVYAYGRSWVTSPLYMARRTYKEALYRLGIKKRPAPREYFCCGCFDDPISHMHRPDDIQSETF